MACGEVSEGEFNTMKLGWEPEVRSFRTYYRP